MRLATEFELQTPRGALSAYLVICGAGTEIDFTEPS